MDWTSTNLVVQVIAGFAGAHFAATALHEHRFGWLGHSLVGLIAGALGGYFLQTVALTVVTGSGSLNEPRGFDGSGPRRDRDGSGRIYDQREICKQLIRPRLTDRSSARARLLQVRSSCATSRGRPFSGAIQDTGDRTTRIPH